MKKADIVIFGGQSNMQGQSETLSECDVVENAFEYRFLNDALTPLRNPVGEDIHYDGSAGERYVHGTDQRQWLAEHALGSACYGHTNLVPSFARAYMKETETALIAVHAAKGSTRIRDWLPDSPGYRMLVVKAASAIQKAKTEYDVRRIFFVWLQGESDAIAAKDRKYYKEKLRILATGLREELGVERFGIIRVGAFTNDGRDAEIISAQDEICAEDPFFLMLTEIALDLNKDLSMMNPRVGGHFSALGLETLGGAAGASLGKTVRRM